LNSGGLRLKRAARRVSRPLGTLSTVGLQFRSPRAARLYAQRLKVAHALVHLALTDSFLCQLAGQSRRNHLESASHDAFFRRYAGQLSSIGSRPKVLGESDGQHLVDLT
jgi:hypothetical protein